jgi:hypothetical protein
MASILDRIKFLETLGLRKTNDNQGLLTNQNTKATGGLLGGLTSNPNLLIGAGIIGQGVQGRDPFGSVLPAVAQTAQIQKLLTPKDNRTPLMKNLIAAGFAPGTKEYQQAMLAATAKTETGAGSVNLVSKSNVDNAKISAGYSIKGLDFIKRVNEISKRSPGAFGLAGSVKGFSKDIVTEVRGISEDAINLAREGSGIEAGALGFVNNKDYSGIKPLQNALKLIVARSRNPNNRLLKDMLIDAGSDSNLRELGGVQKAQEKLQFIAAELTDNAIRQYRAAGLDDAQINEFLNPYKDMFRQTEESSIPTPTSNVPTYVLDLKTEKLKLKK